MKIVLFATVALIAASSLTPMSTQAAPRHGWHAKKVCKTVRQGHHSRRVCRTVRVRY